MGNPVHSRPGSIASPAIACLTAPTAPDTSTRLPNRPTESHRPGPRLSSPACCPADPAPAPLPRTAIGAPNDNQRPPPAPFIGIERGPSRPTALTPCSNPKAAPHRWIRAYGIAGLQETVDELRRILDSGNAVDLAQRVQALDAQLQQYSGPVDPMYELMVGVRNEMEAAHRRALVSDNQTRLPGFARSH